MGEVPKSSSAPFCRQLFVTASVCLNIIGHGAVIGFSAILIPSLRRPESHIQATVSEESYIGIDAARGTGRMTSLVLCSAFLYHGATVLAGVSVNVLIADCFHGAIVPASIVGIALIVGNFVITPLMGSIGRKRSHLLTIPPILLGWFLIVLSNSVVELIVARFLQGVSMGMLGPLGSIIVAEMTNPKNRGAFLTGVSLSLTTGVLFSHTLGSYLSWQQVALISSFITFSSLLLIIFAPESPPWLISKGRYEEASAVFQWLRGHGEDEEELESMIKGQKMIRKSSVVGQQLSFSIRIKRGFRYIRETFKKPEFFKPILIMLFLYITFQFSGINVISSYAIDIIKQVVGPEANAKMLMVAMDLERLICNILAVFLMRTFKRRTVLFTSGTICILSYIAKGGYVYAKQHNMLPESFQGQWLPILLLGIYMFSLTMGISSVPFAISGEIFPLEYRGLAGGISVLPLSLNFFIAVKSFPILTEAIGLPVTYLLYAGVVFICLTFIYFMMPETKDRTLQEIEDSFRGRSALDRRASAPLYPKGVDMMRRTSSVILY